MSDDVESDVEAFVRWVHALRAERNAAIAEADRLRRELVALRDEMRKRLAAIADNARWNIFCVAENRRSTEPTFAAVADRIDAILRGES